MTPFLNSLVLSLWANLLPASRCVSRISHSSAGFAADYGGGEFTKYNPRNKPLTQPFVSLYLRGGQNSFTLKGGDATKGKLQTMYDGPRPDCKVATITPPHPHAGDSICTRQVTNPYNVKRNITPSYQPMHKQGAIVLATGGDNSNSVS
jgi:hypothetical protein